MDSLPNDRVDQMKQLERIGNTVYDGPKVVAHWTHGAWYRPATEKGRPVWEHINPAMNDADRNLVAACEGAMRRER